MIDPAQLQAEFDGDYRPVFLELKKLEQEFPTVHTNQDRVGEDEMAILINTYASLLYSAQDEAADVKSPSEVRNALLALQDVNGFREMITDLVQKFFPQVIVVIERLYFQNRAVIRYFALPASERPKNLRKINEREWMYPERRIDRLRSLSRKIGRANVLAASER
jgi:hypothetical protein